MKNAISLSYLVQGFIDQMADIGVPLETLIAKWGFGSDYEWRCFLFNEVLPVINELTQHYDPKDVLYELMEDIAYQLIRDKPKDTASISQSVQKSLS
jgi:hypothetical protein